MPLKIATDFRKIWEKNPGGRLEHLEQLSLLTLCPNLNWIWIKIQIHSKTFEFEWNSSKLEIWMQTSDFID
jgi:hypothetical protein